MSLRSEGLYTHICVGAGVIINISQHVTWGGGGAGLIYKLILTLTLSWGLFQLFIIYSNRGIVKCQPRGISGTNLHLFVYPMLAQFSPQQQQKCCSIRNCSGWKCRMNSLLLQRKHLPVKLVFLGPATIGGGPTTALLVLSFHSRNAAASNLNFTDTLHARSGRLEHLPSAQWRVLLLVSGKPSAASLV